MSEPSDHGPAESELFTPSVPDEPPPGPGLFDDTPAAVAEPYRVLARKYRPVTFKDLIGQEAMVRILRNAFELGRVAHAFMLTGVRGVGKTTAARIIARALNCTGPDGRGGPTVDPCGVCPNCVAILADRHPDVIEMDAASRTGVDDVREVIEATRFRPMQARKKVFIIDEVHMLSRNAFNALLKTLEEPPEHITFIFATTELRKVPVTVLSRCQRFDLRRVSQEELARHFNAISHKEGRSLSPGAAMLLARAADGSVRDGLSLLDQAIALADAGGTIEESQVSDMLGLVDRGFVLDLFEAIMAGRPDKALHLVDQAYERGADMGTLVRDLLEVVHRLLRLKVLDPAAEGNDLSEEERSRGADMASRLSVSALGLAWQILLKGVDEVETAPNPRQAADMVFIRLCYASDLPPPAELARRVLDLKPAAAPVAASTASDMRGALPPAESRMRLSANGGASPVAESPAAPLMPEGAAQNDAARLESDLGLQFKDWRDVVSLVAEQKEAALHGHLRHNVHVVRFAPPVLELNPEPSAPRDLAQRLAHILTDRTGVRWTVVVSSTGGEPTLAQQEMALARQQRGEIEQTPLMQTVLALFPGAVIGRITDHTLDTYGLPQDPPPDEDTAPYADPDLIDKEQDDF